MEPDWLGYLWDLLDEDETGHVEHQLASSSEARRKLTLVRQMAAPLGYDRVPPSPPRDLVFNTLRRVAEHACRKDRDAAAERAGRSRPVVPAAGSGAAGSPWSRWRRADVLIAAGIALVLLTLAAPAILWLREHQHRVACADNLRQVYYGLSTWANDHGGQLPGPAPRGPLARAGVVMVRLHEGQLLADPKQATCPAKAVRQPPRIPRSSELEQLFQQDRRLYEETVRQMGGCYAYHLGFCDRDNRTLLPVTMSCDKLTPFMADRPHRREEGVGWNRDNSPNHARRGQNVLHLDGSVQFIITRCLGEDDLYLDRKRRVRAGQGPHDHVLGVSETTPLSD